MVFESQNLILARSAKVTSAMTVAQHQSKFLFMHMSQKVSINFVEIERQTKLNSNLC